MAEGDIGQPVDADVDVRRGFFPARGAGVPPTRGAGADENGIPLGAVGHFLEALDPVAEVQFDTEVGDVGAFFVDHAVRQAELGDLGARHAAWSLAARGRGRPSRTPGQRIFINGNDACGLGAVYGGATVAAWYPITPSTSVIEAFTSYCRKFRTDPDNGMERYAIVQAEDELASIGMVIGASWNGARAFTATPGPGISLMQEFFGLAYFAEVPAVIFNVQRGGPSTSMPTRTQQSDLLALRLGLARRYEACSPVPRRPL